jgi:hypothetical protein
MKGKLTKSVGRWFVLTTHYNGYWSNPIPLHTDDAAYCLDNDLGQIVHFVLNEDSVSAMMNNMYGATQYEQTARLKPEPHITDVADSDRMPISFEEQVLYLVKKYPNDSELGKQIRKFINN